MYSFEDIPKVSTLSSVFADLALTAFTFGFDKLFYEMGVWWVDFLLMVLRNFEMVTHFCFMKGGGSLNWLAFYSSSHS